MNCRAAAIGLACAASAIALPSAAAARTHMVWASGSPNFQKTLKARLGGEVNDFFPHQVTIYQGDTVQWQGMWIGFHNVDFPKRGTGDLPFIVPTNTPIGGLTDFAGNPFWFNGQSNLGLNPQLFAATGISSYDGSARADSGLPVGKPARFKLTFTKPGSYVYFCDLHYGMRGIVVVVPRSTKTPTQAQEASAIAAQQSRAIRTAKALARTRVNGKVSVGVSGAGGVDVLAMFPGSLRVRVGSKLTFAIPPGAGETHTVTFGPANYLRPLETSIAGPTPAATAVYPSSESGPIPVPGTHGNGFANSGELGRGDDAPFRAQATFRFTAAGTYQYLCLTHPFMRGTIIVSP